MKKLWYENVADLPELVSYKELLTWQETSAEQVPRGSSHWINIVRVCVVDHSFKLRNYGNLLKELLPGNTGCESVTSKCNEIQLHVSFNCVFQVNIFHNQAVSLHHMLVFRFFYNVYSARTWKLPVHLTDFFS